jgi:hypothetical protein
LKTALVEIWKEEQDPARAAIIADAIYGLYPNPEAETVIRAVKNFGGPAIAALIWDKIGGRSANNFRPAPARPCRFPAPTAFAPSEQVPPR